MALLQERICSLGGTLTEKNLLPPREQILSCKSTIPHKRNEVKDTVPASPFHSTSFCSIFKSFPPRLRFLSIFSTENGEDNLLKT